MITLGSTEYPTRSINFPGKGEVLISTNELKEAIEADFNDEAEEVNDEIFFFVDEDMLNSPEQELIDYYSENK